MVIFETSPNSAKDPYRQETRHGCRDSGTTNALFVHDSEVGVHAFARGHRDPGRATARALRGERAVLKITLGAAHVWQVMYSRMAAVARSRARLRARVGPMLPTGIVRIRLISR